MKNRKQPTTLQLLGGLLVEIGMVMAYGGVLVGFVISLGH